MSDEQNLFGRQLPLTRGPANSSSRPAIVLNGQRRQCQRCHQWLLPTDQLPNQAWYCRQCLQLGRLTSQDKLYTIPEPNRFDPVGVPILTWPGKLSPMQGTAATAILNLTRRKRDQLLWAVTGAGKTEIVYPALAWALAQNWRVAWVSPRVDVCLELAPRLQAAFHHVPQTLRHGKQTTPYRYCQLTLCTTHQLLRFHAAFDWIIVDEVDAFPLATSPLLQTAIMTAQKPTGSHLYLTATPGEQMQRQVHQKKLAVTYLPLRYHGVLLPQIAVCLIWRWRERLAKGKLAAKLVRQLQAYQQRGQRFLLFVPHVVDLKPIAQALQQAGVTGGMTVHAGDNDRAAKVQAMRDHTIPFLITTTILERGVTFPDIAVVVLGGDDPVFSTAALVQIAGRVGRHQNFPTGEVTVYCHSQSRRIRLAQGMISQLNRQGKRLGGRYK
ncbi:DEAD/DEAH box helicase [Levilactobacillus fujinensis]|uniref:DEAD/DEAH box helicase n=1 Tax=Levilactobacillus fujinensis TaxID=2486024 RepID=A0ABW1TE63_9LACO|nr:helicase-related protein [Levilactobacillus fujinensis]